MPLQGTVDHFNPDKGIGVIAMPTGQRFFFYLNNVLSAPLEIKRGLRVEFNVSMLKKPRAGQLPFACEIRAVEPVDKIALAAGLAALAPSTNDGGAL